MSSQRLLKISTLIVGLVPIGVVALEAMRRSDSAPSVSSEPAVASMPLGSFTSPPAASLDESPRSSSELSLQLGTIGETFDRKQLIRINKLPITNAEMTKSYRSAADRACRLLTPGVPVSQPIPSPRPGTNGTLGRVSVFTLGLSLDPAGQQKLPAITRGQVTEYFAKHRMVIQPTLHYDASGKLYFGGECKTALIQLSEPGFAVAAEPMIEAAVRRFRVLGAVGSSTDKEHSSLDGGFGRTLALGFTFLKQDSTVSNVDSSDQETTELLLLHVSAASTPENFEISAYVTSEGRTTLHRLETDAMRINAPLPTIESDIRFDKMVLMGMYPADPVVTRMRYRSAGILSMETISRMTRGDATTPAISLTEILDQFESVANRAPDANAKYVDDEIESVAQQKASQLEATLQNPPTPALPAPKRVKLMTGLGK